MADEARTGGPAGAGGPQEPESSERSLTWVWMVLALVVMGGFLTWLGAASEPTAVPIVETDEDGGPQLAEGVVAVERDSLADNKAMWQGQRIQVEGVEATGQLGPAIFWGELGDRTEQVPMLVRLDSAAAADWQMQDGAFYTITGQVHPMSDSVADSWAEAGEFDGEGEAMQAAFTDYYIQATGIRESPDRSEEDPDEDAGAADESPADESPADDDSPAGES